MLYIRTGRHDGLGGELFLAAGKVEIERTLWCTALFENLVETGGGVSLPTEQRCGCVYRSIPSI